ncbi:MAG TPA: RNase adapter RapZ [Acidiferrobacter sp.]|nr:RNase adapter RapZ [Acidiferrobacter sp.]
MSFIIISGLSGSGKSIALQALEDVGFYCIDNLPAALLPHFAHQMDGVRSKFSDIAVGIDARNRLFLDEAPTNLERLRALGVDYRIIFLEADEVVLVKRFKETRRRHPLTDAETPLLESIRLEKALLEPLSLSCARRIDTTHTSAQQLRQLIYEFTRGTSTPGITLLFESFGFKHGTPLDADYVFDVRCLPNPYWEQNLRVLTGLDPEVAEYLERYPEVGAMKEHIGDFLARWLPGFEQENRSYLTVAIGCTGGQHRSVYLVDRLAAHFRKQGINTQIRHRELTEGITHAPT